MRFVFHRKVEDFNELRLTNLFVLIGIFLLIYAKGWGQITANFNAYKLMLSGRSRVILLFSLSEILALQPNLKRT
jgi:hypothetical protein